MYAEVHVPFTPVVLRASPPQALSVFVHHKTLGSAIDQIVRGLAINTPHVELACREAVVIPLD